ncbi:MAG TPA: hypothetical protein VHW00_04160 [Thermoanaerobaculia bacterium]|nr:hypothetical protein [Thermoanaerobaculia bacterium]
MRLRSLIGLFLLPSVTLVAQEASRTSTAVVPIVGNVIGAGMARWRTDVEIVNDTGAKADVAIELPNTAEQPVLLLTLAPGEVQRFGDITAEAFGVEAVLSPLRITTSGRRSVTVRAQVYAEYGGERSPMQPIATYIGSQYAPIRVLDGLAFSDDFRTNVGLVNFGTHDAEFVLALQRIPGRNVAVTRRRVPAGQLFHEAIQSLFPLITEGNGFAVVIESIAPETYVYASVVESVTQSGRFISPRIAVR